MQGPGPRWRDGLPWHQAHRPISDLQTSSKLYSLASEGWKVTSRGRVSSGKIVPNPSLGWISTNWQTENCQRQAEITAICWGVSQVHSMDTCQQG